MAENRYNRLIKPLADKFYNHKFRLGILQALPFSVGALLTGLAAVLYAKMFAWAESWSHIIFQRNHLLVFVLLPVCFVVGWWIVQRFEKRAAGSGIPQVMAAIDLANPKDNDQVDKLLSPKVIAVKVVSTLVMIFGGAAIGREGPTVQIAGSIFRKVNQWVPASWPRVSKRNMIITGAAAGLAAAFNTPLGGIVFAVEELAKSHISYFKTAIFTGVIIAGLTAQGILGPYLYLGYPDVKGLSGNIIFFIMLVALVAGFLGSFMSVVILRIMAWKRTFKRKAYHILYLVGGALLIACVAYFFSEGILGSGKDQMARILFTPDKHVGFFLPVFRIIGPVISFTTGAAGGVFAPALGAGATIGAYIAELFHFSAGNANIIALAGMVAFLTGVTRSPFTSAILVLEMTDSNSSVFYLMIAGMIASFISLLVDKHSLYDHLRDRYIRDIEQEQATPITAEKAVK